MQNNFCPRDYDTSENRHTIVVGLDFMHFFFNSKFVKTMLMHSKGLKTK